ncbi:sulfate permease [Rhodoferax sp.]|uniref:SulP family inorganic anion transporter n=1 Tax=Rhodoferax sp. TaxID=50421 RepID=UPI00262F3B24|nr:sulfate permease [Rhodoferax sp.]MDD2809650.1 sulfate permease [Rhodoferax sp.]
MGSLLFRLLPFLKWPAPTRATLTADLVAGLTVVLLVVPQSLAYAQLAGVPAVYGLYAAFIPSVVGALFGSSVWLSTGPVALTSLLTAASVVQLAHPGTEQFFASVTLLALLSGIFQVLMGVFKAGVLLNLLSRPVLSGFINAAAVVITLSQLPTLLGIHPVQTGSIVKDTFFLILNVPTLHPASTLLGLLSLGILLVLKRFVPKVPGVLVMVVIMTVVSAQLQFGQIGGQIVGDIPKGLPDLIWPVVDWHIALTLVPAAFVIALVSFMEAMSSCKVMAIKTRTGWDENQELIGQGLAKIVASFCHSMPVSGSFSRSALNLASGARTGYSSVFGGVCILLVLLFFTPLLYHLPKPALAAMIVMAVVNLIDFSSLKRAWAASRDDGLAALVTFGATLLLAPNIQLGILIGISFSLAAFIYRRMFPKISIFRLGESDDLIEKTAASPAHDDSKVMVLRFDAALIFANASFFEDAVRQIEREHPMLQRLIVLATGINLLDASAVDMLKELVVHLKENGIELVFVDAKQHFMDVARRTGLAQSIGDSRFYPSLQASLCVEK